MFDHSLLVRVVAGGARDTVMGHERKDDCVVFLEPLHVFHRLTLGPDQEVRPEELCLRHWGVASPAEKTNVSLEGYVQGPVSPWIRLLPVAEQAYRLALHFKYVAACVQHLVYVDVSVLLTEMTFEARLAPVTIWAAPDEFGVVAGVGLPVYFVAALASHLPLNFRKSLRAECGDGPRHPLIIHGVVVREVFEVAIVAHVYCI